MLSANYVIGTLKLYIFLSFSEFSERIYHNNPKFWNRQARVNSVVPDQMLTLKAPITTIVVCFVICL